VASGVVPSLAAAAAEAPAGEEQPAEGDGAADAGVGNHETDIIFRRATDSGSYTKLRAISNLTVSLEPGSVRNIGNSADIKDGEGHRTRVVCVSTVSVDDIRATI